MTAIENSLPDLLTNVRALSFTNKLRLIEALAGELAHADGTPPVDEAALQPGWTPHHDVDATAVMLSELQPRSFGCHELLDRTSLVADMLEQFVLTHPACALNPEWYALAEQATACLRKLYRASASTS